MDLFNNNIINLNISITFKITISFVIVFLCLILYSKIQLCLKTIFENIIKMMKSSNGLLKKTFMNNNYKTGSKMSFVLYLYIIF